MNVRWILIAMGFMLGSAGIVFSEDYDRLDSVGISKKKVEVIEWEEDTTLQLHVSPKNSIKGIALKVERKNGKAPVMIIGYRFKDRPDVQLVRRAAFLIPIRDGFKVYLDTADKDYDNFLISNTPITGKKISEFKIEGEPKADVPLDGLPRGPASVSNSAPDSAPDADDRLSNP